MVTKFKNHLAKTNLAKNTVTSYVWTVRYFLNHYGGSEQEKTSGVQGGIWWRTSSRRGEPAITRDQQVSGVYETGKIESEVRKGTTKKLSGNVISDAD